MRRIVVPHRRSRAKSAGATVDSPNIPNRVGTTTWSFFSGAMGLDLGLSEAGLAPTLAVEREPVFCGTIKANRPGLAVVERDVSTLKNAALREIAGDTEVDFMVGGPPCQTFCPGGKRAALDDPRGNLIFEYLRVVAEVRPRRFALENVANLLTAAIKHRPISERPGKSWNLSSYSSTHGRLFDAEGQLPLGPDEQSGSAFRLLLDTVIAELGYGVSFGVFDAANFGAPQRRLRVVLIGDRDGHPPPPAAPTHGDGLSRLMTVRDAIGDLTAAPGPGSQYTPEVRAIFDQVPEGGNWRSLERDVAMRAMGEKSYAAGGGKTGFFRRLAWDGQAPTITSKANRKGSALCHPEASRPLSVRECARLQGFPDDWQFCGGMHKQYLQIGNAVPAALGHAIGQMLLAESAPQAPDIDTMLEDAQQVLRSSARNKISKLVPVAA
jgi:DNA (cytosine-5)-methyltransferase 1